MHIGDTVEVVKGEYEGSRARVRGGSGFFVHVQLLTRSGRKKANGVVSLHRTALKTLEKQ